MLQAFELVADSPLAKQRVTTNGPNILLNEDTPIGRSAAGPGNLPIEWAQVSGNHCRIFLVSKDPPVYHLEDNSTNGTAINGTRVPKGGSRTLTEGDHIRLAVATQDPNKVIEYIFRRVLVGKHATNAKRPLDSASPASNPKRAAEAVAAETPDPKPLLQTDTKVLQKLRQSNDDLRKRVEAERQATVEARKKVNELELLLKAEQQSFQDQLADAKAAASDKGIKEITELKSRLAEAEAGAHRDAAACAEARQEVSQWQVALDNARKEMKLLVKERDELAQSVQSMQTSHQAVEKALIAAKQSAVQELQKTTEELQRAIEEKAAAQRRAHDEAVERSSAVQREQELQRDMWEVKGKLQRSEDVCSAAEEKTLCLESFVREGLGSIGRAGERGASQMQLLADMQTTVATFSGMLEKMQAQSAVAKDDMAKARHKMECALSARDQAGFQGTQQPTQGTADGSSGGPGPAALKSPTRSIATQPRSPSSHPPALSPTLAAVAEPTQQREEVAQGELSGEGAQASSFVLNHLIGAQPRSSTLNTPSFGNGSALQEPMSGAAHGLAAAEGYPAGPAGEQEDADMQDPEGDDERENCPDNGTMDEGEKAGSSVGKECSQRGAAHLSVKPTLQLSLQGRDRYGVESHGDEFDDME